MQSSYSPEIDPARAMMLRRCQVIHEAVHNTLRATAEYEISDQADSVPEAQEVQNPLFDAVPQASQELSNNDSAAQARQYVERALQQDKAA